MDEISDADLPVSKTKRKQQAKEVEQIADQLANMPETQLSRLKLEDSLAQEVELARKTRGRGSHKRQIKHLAAILRKREEELQQIIEQLQGVDQVARTEKRQFHRLEDLRDRLCSKNSFDDAFSEMLVQFPQIDRNTIARLARSVHEHEDRRAYREIFKRLRDEQADLETSAGN